MAEPRKVDFYAEERLRDRTLGLLNSVAAARIQFIYWSGLPFYGASLISVAMAIRQKLIGFRTGEVPDDAGAAYSPKEDLIDVPTYDFGQTEYERDALIHECVHAYFDIRGDDKFATWNESIAYVAGSLFTLNANTRPGAAPAVPAWVATDLRREAFRNALLLYGKTSPVMLPADGYKLEAAVLASITYRSLKSTTKYKFNGVGG